MAEVQELCSCSHEEENELEAVASSVVLEMVDCTASSQYCCCCYFLPMQFSSAA